MNKLISHAHVPHRDYYCADKQLEPCGIVIFGASGDLTHRKLGPALLSIFQRGLLADGSFILGCGRTEMTDEQFRSSLSESLKGETDSGNRPMLDMFIKRCHYIAGGYDDYEFYSRMRSLLEELEEKYPTGGRRVFYLSIPPSLFPGVVDNLGAAGLTAEDRRSGKWVHVVVEKPFGHDLESAMELDRQLYKVLDEKQIYRIDHYLGKETVQNLLVFRFANTIFEPVWNRNYIDHVQITVAESVGVEHRAGYYEQSGQLRDMFQNHIMQMLSLVAMEPPSSFDADRVRDEKVKLLRTIRPLPVDNLGSAVVRGQYTAGQVGGTKAPGYRQEAGVAPDSTVETYVAARLLLDNWRWHDVPFYIRSGKRLPHRTSEVAITFKQVPHSMFSGVLAEQLEPNVLVINIQPEEGVSLTFQAKRPGPQVKMVPLTLDFHYRDVYSKGLPDAYERLLIDCVAGDQTLFIRHDEVTVAWSLRTPVLERWAEKGEDARPHPYPAGSWGPEA
ncbi:MAG: glucose-6-phosphate dehydrogenase, partial [Dehalococcoidia bacterium]